MVVEFCMGSANNIGEVAAMISGLLRKSDTSGPMGTNEIIALTGVGFLIALTIYSLIRTLKQVLLNEMGGRTKSTENHLCDNHYLCLHLNFQIDERRLLRLSKQLA